MLTVPPIGLMRPKVSPTPAQAAFFGLETNNPASHLRLDAESQSGLAIRTHFTGELWLYALSFGSSTRKPIVNRDSNGIINVGINWGFGLSGANNGSAEVYFTYTTSPTFGTTRHHDVPHGAGDITGAWHHIAATRDHTIGETKLFFDGALIGTLSQDPGSNPPWDASPAYVDNNMDVLIGAHGSSGIPSALADIHGYLAEVRVWNVVRTPAEIAANYNQALIGNETGLFLYMPMISDFNDYSGNGNHFFAVAGADAPAPSIQPIARPF